MKHVGPGRRASVLAALAVLLGACEGGTDGPKPTAVVAASATTQTAVVGTAVAEAPSVRVTDQDGQAMAGVAVTFVVSAGGGSLGSGAATTNAQGVATAGAWTLGTAAGQNAVTATVGRLAPVQFIATAMPRSPATITAVSATTQTGLPGTPVTQVPTVRVNDQTGQPLAGATVTFTVTGGGGQVGSATAVTGANGQASAGSWTLGSTPGQNTLSATVTGLAPVVFTATVQNPCSLRTPYTVFTTIQGSLAASDCRLTAGTEVYFADLYSLQLATAQMLELRMSSSQVDAWLEVYDADLNLLAGNDDDFSGTDTNAGVRMFIPSGSYIFAATTAFGHEVGSYTISSATFAGNTECGEFWLIPGVVVTGSITETDCDFGSFTDEYAMILQAGQRITVRMESPDMDPVLELYSLEGGLVASDDDSGGGTVAQFTYTATEQAIFFLDATNFDAADTGSYTLTVSRN